MGSYISSFVSREDIVVDPLPITRVPTGDAYMDIRIGNDPLRRIEFELYDDKQPLTCKNFRHYCSLEKGGYRGAKFHRVVKHFMAQGGDMIYGNGTGHVSMYGASFKDEDLTIKHGGRGTLAMANRGPDTNGSQFYITLGPTPWLDGIHVVFGRVTRGEDLLKRLDEVATMSGATRESIIIVACGVALLNSNNDRM